MRFVLVIDEKGNAIHSQIITKSFLIKNNQAIALSTDMVVLKRLLNLYDVIIGKNTFTHLIRDKVHVLIFYIKDWIFLVSCDRSTASHTIADISEKIESIIKIHFA
ncbi:MAG TPA: hypothetical protein VFG24_03905 [Nitrosopumilaceae archaeon]|nr:hypothetical protein [Nitrosopumilaceae archaeon]